MKFSTRTDINAPIETVWASVTNAEAFEQRFRTRGVAITRTPEDARPAVGTAWTARFSYAGLGRDLTARIVKFDAPELLEMAAHVSGIDAEACIALEALPRDRTRMRATLELKPSSMPGRLLLQTLKLAREPLSKRLDGAITRYGRQIARGLA